MSSTLVEQKEAEVQNLARKYGVERYLGTERLDDVQNIVEAWAEMSKESNALSRESAWLDAKTEIEAIMTDISLANNAKSQLYLLGGGLGAVANGNVSFDEVKNAFIDGWNTLLNQYAGIIEKLPPHEIAAIDRMKDKSLASVGDYGTIDQKNNAGVQLSQCLKNIEQELIGLTQKYIHLDAKNEVGNRETTRGIIMSQANADFSSGILTQAQLDQINALIGYNQNPASQLQGQISTLDQFSPNYGELLNQMDRTLAAAKRVLDQTRDSNGLAGSGLGFVRTARQETLGRINAMGASGGDGIRTMDARSTHRRATPKVIGSGVPYSGNMVTRKGGLFPEAFAKEGPAGMPWIGNQFETPSDPMVVPHDMHLGVSDPALSHRIYSTHGNLGSTGAGRGRNPRRMGQHIARNKMAGLHKGGFGGFFTDPDGFTDAHPKMTWLGTLGVVAFLGSVFLKERTKRDIAKMAHGVYKKPKQMLFGKKSKPTAPQQADDIDAALN